MTGRRHRVLAALLAAALGAGAARADVFEVDADGTMHAPGEAAARAADPDGGFGGDGPAEPGPDLPDGAVTLLAAPDAPPPYRPALIEAARRYALSPSLLAALVWQESRWQPGALSAKGAIGLGQLMPATARALAVDPREAGANLVGAAHYLRQLLDLFDGDVEKALAAYNAGPARVLKANGVPAIVETRDYVAAISRRLATAAGSRP